MRVSKNIYPIVIWLSAGNYSQKLAICNFFLSKSGEFRSFFPLKNPFYMLKSNFFSGHKMAKIHHQKKKKKKTPCNSDLAVNWDVPNFH
jgi:hypothetical protein